MLESTLLVSGLVFPTLSALTCVASFVTQWKYGRYASPVIVPVVGPVFLTCWVLIAGHSLWFVPLVWLLDIGTIVFLAVLPRFVREWWRFSIFTQVMTLRGSHGIEVANLTFHRGGHYCLEKSWNRAKGDLGVVGLWETGTFTDNGNVLAMKSDHGLSRVLQRIDHGAFAVSEPDKCRPDLQNYSLHAWRLYC